MALTERAIQQISFVEFLGCMANMCLLGYYAIVVRTRRKLSMKHARDSANVKLIY